MSDLIQFDQTIPGGKYLAADGVTYIDAWGKPIAVDEPEPKADETPDEPEPKAKPATKKDA